MADGFLRSLLYEGCISGCNLDIERRPYHQNCRCAFHDKSLAGNCSGTFPKNKKVSYPIRRSWSEGCLAVAAASLGHSSPSSPSSVGVGKRRLESYKEEKEDN